MCGMCVCVCVCECSILPNNRRSEPLGREKLMIVIKMKGGFTAICVCVSVFICVCKCVWICLCVCFVCKQIQRSHVKGVSVFRVCVCVCV